MRIDLRGQEEETLFESLAFVYSRQDGFQRLISTRHGGMLHIRRARTAAPDPTEMESREARCRVDRAKNALEALEKSGRIECVRPGAYMVHRRRP